MSEDGPTDADLAEILRVVRHFVPKPRQARWKTVLEGNPSKWSRLDMDDLFRVAEETSPVHPVEVEEELEAPDLMDDPIATLFRFSAEPYFLRGPVRHLVDAVVGDDALILVHHGRVVLASHHSSGWVVCRFHARGCP